MLFHKTSMGPNNQTSLISKDLAGLRLPLSPPPTITHGIATSNLASLHHFLALCTSASYACGVQYHSQGARVLLKEYCPAAFHYRTCVLQDALSNLGVGMVLQSEQHKPGEQHKSSRSGQKHSGGLHTWS